jgi:hypothetical protein
VISPDCPTARVSRIGKDQLERSEVDTLAACVKALGGKLKIIADFGDETCVLWVADEPRQSATGARGHADRTKLEAKKDFELERATGIEPTSLSVAVAYHAWHLGAQALVTTPGRP